MSAALPIPVEVDEWVEDQGYGPVVSSRPAGGGCISDGRIISASSGASFFLKVNSNVPDDFFRQEAAGLNALAVPGGTRIPVCCLVGEDYILLEDLKPAGRTGSFWQELGRGLATIHDKIEPRFGFADDNFIGSTKQPNPWIEDGYEFFADQRLSFQAKLAFERRLLGPVELKQVENLNRRLPELIPLQPASITHGDLWSGNLMTDETGGPALIDPAAYYGWAEADLAMMTLFGSYPEDFIQAYTEVRPLEPGLTGRFRIYNLYHLLNHLNLFGGGYLHEVQKILKKFS